MGSQRLRSCRQIRSQAWILKRSGEVCALSKTFPRSLFAEASKCSYFAQEREKHPQSLITRMTLSRVRSSSSRREGIGQTQGESQAETQAAVSCVEQSCRSRLT